MKAVILAGGKGTRLRPLTYARVKAMIPFLNKPVLEHIITKLVRQGFDEIILTTNYKTEQIADYFGDGKKFGCKFTIVIEKEALGTAGSVKNAVHHLDDTFALIQGDNISEIDVGALYRSHKKMGGMATISLMEVEDVSHFGIAEMKGDEIIKFKEKPKPEEAFSNLANAGIYILEPEVLDMIPLAFYDFSKNLFPRMLEEGKKICGSVTHSFWKDVGRPEDYLSATHYMLKQKNVIADGCRTTGAEITESVLGRGCKVQGASIASSVLFDNVTVEKGARLKHCIIGSNTTIGEGVDIWPGAVIGDDVEIIGNCVVHGNARVGPHIKLKGDKMIEGTIVPEHLKEAD